MIAALECLRRLEYRPTVQCCNDSHAIGFEDDDLAESGTQELVCRIQMQSMQRPIQVPVPCSQRQTCRPHGSKVLHHGTAEDPLIIRRLETILGLPRTIARHFETEIRLVGTRADFAPIQKLFDHPDLCGVIVVLLVASRAGVVLGLVLRMVREKASSTVLERCTGADVLAFAAGSEDLGPPMAARWTLEDFGGAHCL